MCAIFKLFIFKFFILPLKKGVFCFIHFLVLKWKQDETNFSIWNSPCLHPHGSQQAWPTIPQMTCQNLTPSSGQTLWSDLTWWDPGVSYWTWSIPCFFEQWEGANDGQLRWGAGFYRQCRVKSRSKFGSHECRPLIRRKLCQWPSPWPLSCDLHLDFFLQILLTARKSTILNNLAVNRLQIHMHGMAQHHIIILYIH